MTTVDTNTPDFDLFDGGEPEIKAVVLDVDDTLYLKRDYVRSGFEAVGRWARRELRIDDFAQRAWAAFESGARHTIFDEVLTSCGARADDAVITEMVARYRTHQPNITLAGDAREALNRWSRRAELAVVCDGPQSGLQAKLRALGLDHWDPLVVCTASFGPGRAKPHPAAFAKVAEDLGVSGPACVYVGDDPHKDFAGPKSLGWRTVRLRRRLGVYAGAASGDDVDHEINNFDQFDTVIANSPPSRS